MNVDLQGPWIGILARDPFPVCGVLSQVWFLSRLVFSDLLHHPYICACFYRKTLYWPFLYRITKVFDEEADNGV